MTTEVHEFPARAGRMLNELGPLLGGHVVCVVVLAGAEVCLMYPAGMSPEAIEAIENALAAITLQSGRQ